MTGTPLNGRRADLVIFDCDGVLIDSEVIAIRQLVDGLDAIGCQMEIETASRRFVGRGWMTIRTMIEADWGKPLPVWFEDEVERRTRKAMARDLQPVRGIGEVLKRIDHPRCVASSSSMDWITEGLHKTGLLHHFRDCLFSASMVENGKPAPDVFLHAARVMKTAPSRAWVVEDSLPGVQAGVAAGMIVIGFTGGRHIRDPEEHGARLREVGAAMVIDDMAALPGLLAGSNS